MTRWLAAAKAASNPNDKTDNTDETHPRVENAVRDHNQKEVLSVSSVLSKGGKGTFQSSPDLRRDLKLDPVAQPDDADRYADALRLHGPMSYGMTMRVLQWGGTRAGQAETALHEAGRIAFNDNGRAYLLPGKESER